MALTRTTTELATAVLRELSQIDAAEDSDDHTEAQTVVTDAYNDKYYELRYHKLAYWTQTAIPVEVFGIVRDLVINEVSGTFGEPIPAETREKREQIILKRLRRIMSRRPSGHPTYSHYF